MRMQFVPPPFLSVFFFCSFSVFNFKVRQHDAMTMLRGWRGDGEFPSFFSFFCSWRWQWLQRRVATATTTTTMVSAVAMRVTMTMGDSDGGDGVTVYVFLVADH
jgi:hypothetical protein